MGIIGTNGVINAYMTHQRHYGPDHRWRVLNQTVEEAAEVIQAIQKFRRNRDIENLDRMKEEVADLLLCLDFFCRCFCSEDEMRGRVSSLAVDLDAFLNGRRDHGLTLGGEE